MHIADINEKYIFIRKQPRDDVSGRRIVSSHANMITNGHIYCIQQRKKTEDAVGVESWWAFRKSLGVKGLMMGRRCTKREKKCCTMWSFPDGALPLSLVASKDYYPAYWLSFVLTPFRIYHQNCLCHINVFFVYWVSFYSIFGLIKEKTQSWNEKFYLSNPKLD